MMNPKFSARFRLIRIRVLAFVAIFHVGAGLGIGAVLYASPTEGDPGPIIYLFPVSFAIVMGTFPALAYFLGRWCHQFDVANCPTCHGFLWPTTLHAVAVALLARCPHCSSSLTITDDDWVADEPEAEWDK